MKRNLIILSIIFLQSINGFAQNKIKSITYNVNDCINAYYKSQLWKDIHPKITDVDFEVSQYNASDVHSWGGQDVFAIPIAIKITGIKFIDGNNQSVYLNYNEMQIISGGNWYGMVSGSGIFINTALGNTEKSRSFNIKTAIDGSGRERIEIELKGWSEFISASAPKLKAQGITPTLEKRYEYLNSKLVSDNLSFEIEQNTKEKLKTIIDNYLEKQNSNNQSNYSTYYSEGRQKELAGDYRGAIAAYEKSMKIKRVYEVQQRINECHKKIDEETERNNRKSYNQEQQQGYSSVTIPRTNYSSNEAHYYSGNNNSNNYSANQQNATNNKQKQMDDVNKFINQQNKEIEQMNKTINDAFKPLHDAINAHYEAKIAELDRLEAMHEQYLKDLKNLEKIFEEQIEDMFRSKKYRLNEDIRNALYRQDYEYFKAWHDYYRDYEDLNEDWYNYNKQTIQNKDRQVSSRIHNYNFKNSYRYDEPERTEPRKPDVEMANPNYFNAEDWYDAAVFNKEKRRNEKAIDFIKLALNKKPENIKYNLYLAYLYQSGKNTDDAIETYQFVLSIAPENEKALQNLRYLNYQQGLKYYNSKNYNQAKEYLGDYKLYGGNNLDVDLMYYTSIMHSDTNFSDYAKMKISEIENLKNQQEFDLFNQTEEKNTIEACDVYLSKYPKGEFAQDVRLLKDNIAYKTAEAKNTFEAYMGYLKNYPKGSHVIDSKLKIKEFEDSEFLKAKSNSNIALCDYFIRNFPDSPKINEINAHKSVLVEDNLWNDVTRKGNVSAYREYLAKYPNGRYSNDAKSWISKKDKTLYDNAVSHNSISQYNFYLSEFPNGNYVSKVKNLRYKKLRKERHYEHRKNMPFYLMYNYGVFTEHTEIRYPLGFIIGYSVNDEMLPPSTIGGYIGLKSGSFAAGLTLGSGNLGNFIINGGATVALYTEFGDGMVLVEPESTIGIDIGLSYKIANRFITNVSYLSLRGKGPNALSVGLGIVF